MTMQITFSQSPNYTPGRQGNQVDTVVYHWIDGYQSVADSRFADPSSKVSAHFSVEDASVHQYVRIQDTAWHAGNWPVNLRSVGIEHSAQPGRDASDATYASSAQLVLQVARSLGKRVDDLRHIPHSSVRATQCPGTLNIGRIVQQARSLEGAQAPVDAVLASAHDAHAPEGSFQPFLVNLKPYGTVAPAQPDQEVKRMQAFLTARNNPATGQPFFKDAGPQDGWYGPKTQAAVHSFQGANGITNTSEYGWWYDLTRDKANQQLSNQQTSNA